MKNIHFLLTITRREDSEAFVDFFNSRDLSCIYSAVAEGTARQKTLALLGLERSYKSIHCAVVPEAAQRKFYAICPPKCRSICRIAASPLPFRS